VDGVKDFLPSFAIVADADTRVGEFTEKRRVGRGKPILFFMLFCDGYPTATIK
jgi:hypothetical protein